jgi:HAE1 family hydrophobic/amphiphilic exporter-1
MIRTIAVRFAQSLALGAALAASANITLAQTTPTPIPTPIPAPLPSPTPEILSSTAKPLPPLPDLRRVGIRSDSPLVLSLNDSIRRALENNNDIEVARGDVLFAETSLRSLEGVYDAVFTFTPNYNNTTQANSQVFSGAASSLIRSTTFSTDADVTKLFSYGGGSYTAFFNNTRQTTNSSLFTLAYRPVFGVQFTQPLWRNFSIDNNRRNIRIQKKRLQQTDLDFRLSTMNVILNVQRAYWDLVFALRNQQNLVDNLNLSRENLRRVEAQIAAGAAAPIARAEINTELANRESDLLVATQNVSIAENVLKTLMFRDPNTPEWTAQITPTDNPVVDTTPVDLEGALKAARANRPELLRLSLQKEINGIDLKYFSNQTKPRIDLTSVISTNGLAGTPRPAADVTSAPLISTDPAVINLNANAFLLNQVNILRVNAGLPPVIPPIVTTVDDILVPENLRGGFGKALSNAFNFDTRTIEFGLVVQIPFRNRTAEANLAGARVQQNQIDAQVRAQEQTVIQEVRNAVQAVETARLRVVSARTARENAEVQLAGENRLFQVGRSTAFLLFQRENELANARNAEVQAETDYNKALADLQRATSTTLTSNNITVTTPTGP